jgi:hypothetical protein
MIAIIKRIMVLTILDILHSSSWTYMSNHRIVLIGTRESGIFVEICRVGKNSTILSFHVTLDNILDYWIHSGFRQGPHYRSHRGLHNQLERLLPTLLAFIVQSQPGTLHFTGHGQGGALALLGGAHVATMCPDRMIHVVTTGTPKVGSHDFRMWYDLAPNLNLDRIVIDEDTAPQWSPRNYVHCGTEWCLPINNNNTSSRFRLKKRFSQMAYFNLFEEVYPRPLRCS